MNDKILEQMLQIIIRYINNLEETNEILKEHIMKQEQNKHNCINCKYINITMDDELENMKCDCLHPNQKKGYKEYWRNATKENDCSCFEWNVKGENNE